jgi:3-oxoacyl-[acyl-carrier protein] reductase
MDLGLKGKIALVSGGSSGIGLGTARGLAAEGARVMLVARDEEKLAAAAHDIAASGGEVSWVSADTTTKAGVEKSVVAISDVFGAPPDIAIGSIGPTRRYGFDDASDDDFRLGCEEVVMAQVYLARAVLPSMKANRWGRLLSVSTIAAKEPHRWLNVPLTNTFRPGQLGLNKTLSNEFSEFGITVNTVLPGLIDTGRAEAALKTAAERGTPELVEPMPRLPIGRPGRPEEVSAVCIFLCSEAASYITGQAISVDGGWVRGLY